MNPAYSIIFFTTASGAGYGLLGVLGLYAWVGKLPDSLVFGALTMAVGVLLVTAGFRPPITSGIQNGPGGRYRNGDLRGSPAKGWPITSGIQNGPGGRYRNGDLRGSPAKGWPRWLPLCLSSAWPVAGSRSGPRAGQCAGRVS